MKLALRPVGKNAPPRPRRFDWMSWSVTSCGFIARARSSWAYPSTARYDARSVSGCSIAPSRTTTGGSKPIVVSAMVSQLRDDRGHVFGCDRLAVTVVDRDDRRRRAAAQALHGAQRDRAVRGRLARPDPELSLERLEHGLRVDDAAADVRADLDHVRADGLEVEHVVEARHRHAVGGRQVERVRDLLERLPRQPAVLLLCD